MKSSDPPNPREIDPKAFEPVVITNEKEHVILHGGDQGRPKLLRQAYSETAGSRVIDDESLKMIQVLRLHEAVDHTASATGSAVLLRSLIQPSTDLHHIQSKQESLREIAANDSLQQGLRECVHAFCKREDALYKFFNKGLYALFPYPDFKRARKASTQLGTMMRHVPPAASPYLQSLMAGLEAYRDTPIDRMMTGAVYKTLGGLKSGREVGFFTPKIKFIPRRFTKWLLAGPAVALAPLALSKLGFADAVSPMLTTIGLAWTGVYAFYAGLMKPLRDTDHFIDPFREQCIHDPAFSRAVDAVGMIDELLSCHDFAKEMPHATTLPAIADEPHHAFEATGLRNPVIAKANPDFVPNDVKMNGARLTFISGPNSGGKTTICKSIVHNQLLAQMGCYVVAEKAAINIADMVSYQAPKFDGLEDEEGRFGTELSRTRDIFYATGPKSLVILDELAEGTTVEERLQESFGIMSDFHVIGNNTVLVTHNHSLVDGFMAENKGQCLMVAFDEDAPTYKIVPGISRVSHAAKIAEKIKFSPADRRRHLKEKGYL